MRSVRRLVRDVAANMRHDMTTTIATVLTATVALCLLGVAMLANAQIAAMKDAWYDKVEVSVFLCTDTSVSDTCAGEPGPAGKKAIYDALVALPEVQHVYFESRDDAWKMFQERFSGSEITNSLTPQALPESFRVKLKDPTRGAMLEAALTGQRGVELVQDQRKMLARFFGLLEKVQAAALVIAMAALIAASVLIAAGLRVAITHRRREISVMRLVGAHAATIRRPFMVASVLQGVAGGLVAGASVVALKAWFIDGQVTDTSVTRTVSWEAAWQIAGGLIVVGTVIAIVVAATSLRRQLRQ